MSAWPVTLGLLRALGHKLQSVYSYHLTGAGKSPSTPGTLRAQITPACGVTCCRSDILIPCGFSGVPTIPSAAVIQTETEGATLLGSSPQKSTQFTVILKMTAVTLLIRMFIRVLLGTRLGLQTAFVNHMKTSSAGDFGYCGAGQANNECSYFLPFECCRLNI